jgi:hypothetical protein
MHNSYCCYAVIFQILFFLHISPLFLPHMNQVNIILHIRIWYSYSYNWNINISLFLTSLCPSSEAEWPVYGEFQRI